MTIKDFRDSIRKISEITKHGRKGYIVEFLDYSRGFLDFPDGSTNFVATGPSVDSDAGICAKAAAYYWDNDGEDWAQEVITMFEARPRMR